MMNWYMPVSRAIIILASLVGGFVTSFSVSLPSRSRTSPITSSVLFSSGTPTMKQLSSDPFMSQVSHAANLVERLSSDSSNDNKEELVERLAAQLSHSDGIRGFFVTYLTADGDLDEVPAPLVKAMTRCNPDNLIPLACMNVVMPTATSSMHKDPALSEASSKTAARGLLVLKALLENDSMVKENCKAIYAAASLNRESNDDGVDRKLVEYWTEFFSKYGYKERQLSDIAQTFEPLV